MAEDSLEDPVDLANRAKRQGKHAAKNAAKAGRVAAEPALEEARETVDKLEGTAEDALRTAKRFNPRVFGRLAGNTGQAFLALSVACYAATLSASKFREVYVKRGQLLNK